MMMEAKPSKQLQGAPGLIFELLSRSKDSSSWILHRTIKSNDSPSLSGTATGTATLTPLRPGSASGPERQLLYHERGTYTGPSFQAPFEKKYIWTHRGENQLSVYFVKCPPQPQSHHKGSDHTNGGEGHAQEGVEEEIDYLFHTLSFNAPELNQEHSGQEATLLRATGSHLCIKDMYDSSYVFHVRDADFKLVEWEMRHVVKGPKKDQVIETWFS